jgi:RimJ/RimL family protein N-acetyltransferase
VTWPTATRIETARLTLEPLSPRYAQEMVSVLATPELYAFTGGEPPTGIALHKRYSRQAVGHSPADDAGWSNWIIRERASQAAVGYVQATLTMERDELTADVAWLVTPSAQHRGIASEAATALLAWLLERQVFVVRAMIHPDHHASARVAQRLGLVPTAALVDGESVWELRCTGSTDRRGSVR